MTPLGEIAQFEMGQAPPGPECNGEGVGTLFVKAGEFGERFPVHREWTTKPLKFGRNGDVFICVVGATAGKLNLGIDCAIGRSVAAIRPAPELDARFLYYQLQPWVLKLRAASAGSAQGVITKKQLAQIPVKVPALEEQRRIVAEIEKQFSRLDEAIANLKHAKTSLSAYRTAVLKSAVEGRLVPTEAELADREERQYESGAELLKRIAANRRAQWSGRGQYREAIAPITLGRPKLPVGWVWASAEQLSDFITKGTTPAAKKLHADTGEIQFLKVYNLTFDGSLNYSYKPTFIDGQTHSGELARSRVQPGDVLINIVGPPLGQVSIVPDFLIQANINQAIARFRPIEPVTPEFLALVLMSKDIMQWAVARAKTTAGQANLTLELCRALPLPLPPVREQHRIVTEVDRCISVIQELERLIELNVTRSNLLRAATLVRFLSDRSH